MVNYSNLLKRSLRILKHLFVALHTLLFVSVLLISALLYIAFRSDGLELLREYILSPIGVHYVSSKGSLRDGITLHGLQTQEINISTLALDYNLTSILQGKQVVDSIRIDGLQINLEDFVGDDDDSSTWVLPRFALKEVNLTNIQLISSYPISLNIHGNNGSFDGKNLNFKNILVSAQTRYASGVISGRLKNNAITGKGRVYPCAPQLDGYVADFVTLPVSHPVEVIELSNKRARLSMKFDTLSANFDPKIVLSNITLGMDYRYADSYLDFTALYKASRELNVLQTSQKLRYTLSGVTTTTFTSTVLASQIPLPYQTISGSFRDDSQGLAGKVSMGDTSVLLQSSDYNSYKWYTVTHNKSLEFFSQLPAILQNSPLSGSAHGEYRVDSGVLDGKLDVHHNHADINATLYAKGELVRLQGIGKLNHDDPLWKDLPIKPPLSLAFSFTHDINSSHLSLDGENVSLWVKMHGDELKGAGKYYETFFDIDAHQNDATYTAQIASFTPSLNKTLSFFPSAKLQGMEYYDAQIRTKTTVVYDGSLRATTDVEVPWYAAITDSKHSYSGVDNTFSLEYNEGKISISKYLLDVMDHKITSHRPSYLHIDSLGNLVVDEVWIFDALRLDGTIDTSTLMTRLNLASEKFTYTGPEGEARVALDLHYDRDENASQKLTGNITLLDGTITYLPLQQFKVMDDDVIIVQDVRPPSTSSLAMEVKIQAARPLHYLTKELDVYLTPDITLWKDAASDMQILGMITFPSGTIATSGKKFALRPSHVYFGGAIPVNPYLDITLDYEVDYKKIQIYVMHRLDSPIFLFASDPVMSQNDIMSYILFGASSDTALNSSSSNTTTLRADSTNFMLGAGLKGLIGGATKIQLDTMNILTTKEGGMGFEVGTRLNDDIRILYKNDTISSVLIQYALNRSVRIDADIHELGQGVNVVYIKDFRDFLRHNPPKLKRQ